MRRYYIVSGILLINSILDFALAAPVLVQEKRQACADIADKPAYPITVLRKRGAIDETGLKYIANLFEKQKESSVTHVSSSSAPASSVAHVSSSSAPSEPHHGSTDVDGPLPSIPKGWSQAPIPDRTSSSGPSTKSAHLLTWMHAPLSSPVYPTYFHPDNELLGAHVSQPNIRPWNPSAKFGSNNRLMVEEPPSPTKGSSTESDFEMVNELSSSPVSSTDLNRQAKKLRPNSGTARDVANAVQSELQPEKSHDSNEPEDPGALTVRDHGNF